MSNNTQISKKIDFRLCLRSFFAGEKCASCGETDTEGVSVLCPSCIKKLREKGSEICPRCKKPALKCRCVRKNMSEAGVSLLFKLGFYRSSETDSPLNAIIYRLKRTRDRLLAEFTAEEMKEALSGCLCEGRLENAVITYVPRSRKKVFLEGTDQAKLLAMSLADSLGMTCWGLIERNSNGRGSQKRLGVAQRDESVEGLFRAVDGGMIRGRTIILIDDLITTGATVSECAGALKAAGARDIICVAIAEA